MQIGDGDMVIRPPMALLYTVVSPFEGRSGSAGCSGGGGGGAGHAGGGGSGSARGTTSYCTKVGLEKEMSITSTNSCQI